MISYNKFVIIIIINYMPAGARITGIPSHLYELLHRTNNMCKFARSAMVRSPRSFRRFCHVLKITRPLFFKKLCELTHRRYVHCFKRPGLKSLSGFFNSNTINKFVAFRYIWTIEVRKVDHEDAVPSRICLSMLGVQKFLWPILIGCGYLPLATPS